ncbi:type VI secretion system protein IglI family protein [Piscirickettsia litoralis]|uniref:Uncharacterized protein n=1 Tax=Piscirickettsia litoralis TaxID=1891921 RepID=A0ABX3A951_9GAMM|nr:type VI secretion system protein IglI family protein [Piscirickettsia litoralis]ODN43960.1 hypothetical protein BGC07_15055 [Piscirickettsia litoralis]
MNKDVIEKFIYDLKYQDALESLLKEFDQDEIEISLDLLSYSCVCHYIVEGVLSGQLAALSAFTSSDGFDISKVKKITKTLAWVFDTINDHINENKLTLNEPVDDALLCLAAFKESLPDAINMDTQLNKLKSYLLKAKSGPEVQNEEEAEQIIEEKPIESIKTGSHFSPKLDELFKKIELCMELSNQNRVFEAALFYCDIQEKISHFDPVVYFPEVFVPFFRNLSKSYVKIQKIIDSNQDTLEWHIAEQIYKASPEKLVSGGSLFESDELKSTNELTGFIREHGSLSPTTGVINKESYSRVANNEAYDSEFDNNKENFEEFNHIEGDSPGEREAESDFHNKKQKNDENKQNHDALNDIEGDYKFDFEFD